MEYAIPSMTRLFAQLGLQSTPTEIDAFITAHRPLPASTRLQDTNFWSTSQSDFLRSEVDDDTVWSIVIERLNATLRRRP
jgi:hypothetical protein